MSVPSTPDELRAQLREIIGFNSPKYVESVGIIGLSLPAYRFDEIMDNLMSTIQAFYEEREKKDVGIAEYMVALKLQLTMAPLMLHRLELGFPSMTAEIIGNLHEEIVSYLSKNEHFMRQSQNPQAGMEK